MRATLPILAVGLLGVSTSLAGHTVVGPDVPRYHRGMWLMDSLAVVDLIVVGTPRLIATPGTREASTNPLAGTVVGPAKPPAATLEVAKTLFGSIHKDLQIADDIKLVAPYRCQSGAAGLWLLLRTPQGYFVLNPEPEPLPVAEWPILAKLLAARPPPRSDLKLKAATHQFYHYYVDKRGGDVWHGMNVWVGDNSLYTELFEDGRRILIRGWDGLGRLETVYRPGLSLRFLHGRVWEFSRYAGDRKAGVSRSYFQEDLEQPREEGHWQDGLRHGPTRQWDTRGKLVSEVIYETGFVPPVVRYRGKAAGRAKLHQREDDNWYEADRELMDALKIGLSTAEVSGLLKLDFSETDGIFFPRYDGRQSLHIVFEEGRIAARDIGRRPSFDPRIK